MNISVHSRKVSVKNDQMDSASIFFCTALDCSWTPTCEEEHVESPSVDVFFFCRVIRKWTFISPKTHMDTQNDV